MKKFRWVILLFIVFVFIGCGGSTLWGPSGASTFNNPDDYQWVKTADGRVIPVKKEDAWRYSQ